MNRVTLFGNVGADPEIRNTPSGKKVANIRLATTERWRDSNGERQERTEWHTLIIWANGKGDGLVGVVEKYVGKGDKILVEGKLQTRKWQDQDGKDRYSTEIIVDDLTMCGSPQGDGGQKSDVDRSSNGRSGSGNGGSGNRRANEDYGRDTGRQGSFSSDLDDDIPF